jgi:2-keto-4-pentenoate hydratase/2-oxohepta-3-ene-1,7-dioic acid hydratase in catechol pathway
MKLLSFVRTGQAGFGALVEDGVIDLTGLGGAQTLKGALEAGLLPLMADTIAGKSADLPLSGLTLLPVIPDPSKILCIGLNYHAHKKETGRPDVSHPTVFTRYADSQVAHRQALVKPKATERFDYEGELAIVIGTAGHAISKENALDHVAGYACYNDGSVRDWQRHTFQFTPGKTFPGTGAFGPYLVTTDEVGDYTKLPIQTRLNGKVMQDATLADLLFPIEDLIAYCSQFTPLAVGDVIVTGTPGGVGDKRDPAVYMVDGDIIEVAIGKVGTLINPIVAEENL